MIRQGEIRAKRTKTGKFSGYEIEMFHDGLNEVKHLSAKERYLLEGKIHNQINAWDKKWETKIARERKEQERQLALQKKQQNEELATTRTEQAKQALSDIETILLKTLDIDDAVDWESIKSKRPFRTKHKPHKLLTFRAQDGFPEKVETSPEPKKPLEEDFFTKIPLMKIISGQKNQIQAKQQQRYDAVIKLWQQQKNKIRAANASRQKKLKELQEQWLEKKKAYEAKQVRFNQKIDALKDKYQQKDAEAIQEYCEIVLNNSSYPESFPKDFELQYNPNNHMLLVDYVLPDISDIPSLNIVKYVKSRDEFQEKYLSKVAHEKLFDSAIYQVTLRTIHELFEADVVDALTAISFNGIVTNINPATGHAESKCILSVQTTKEEFEKIHLANIDPKQCFKALKGVGSAKLSSLTPVRPIIELDTSDKRFTEHYDVADSLDEETNLAAMNWEDFEHLVRELFEKEFAQNGGEVKITQASSDGGVDAVAFDPDPIRGGKIVIQAKRYTNVVGVAAVRDLYGTVMSEGATKGILVTTSDYGADSYNFAKNKPLTLLNGANLLYLLEKHGYQAKIDIAEAKKALR